MWGGERWKLVIKKEKLIISNKKKIKTVILLMDKYPAFSADD